MNLKRRFQNLVAIYWQPMALYGLLLGLFSGLLWFRLGSLTGGFSAGELATLQAGGGLMQLLDNPVNAPFSLLVYGLSYLKEDSLLLVRAIATLFGLITLTAFYWLVRHWHGERSAILGTIVFGCSAWFLHTARLGTPEVLLFLLLALVACAAWLKRTSGPLVLVICFVLATVLLYVPGMVWFVALGVLWQWRTIDRIFKEHLGAVTLGGLLMLAIMAPLGWAIYKTPALAKVLAGLPAQGWPEPLAALHRLIDIPTGLFLRGPQDPEHWLARLPILAAFSVAMLLLGVFVYLKHWRLKRSKILGATLLISVVLIALGGAITMSVVIPIVYVLVAAGMGLLLERWYRVFPRNIIAQGIGIGLISLAVLISSAYNLRRYFVAWPAAPATKQVFIISQVP